MGKELLQMFSLSQYIYCSIALLFTHTHQRKKNKEHCINNPFLLRMNNGIQARDCLEMKAETNYQCSRQHQYLVFWWVVLSHIVKDGK